MTSLASAWTGRALGAVVVLAVFNAVIAQLLSASRLLFGFARDGVVAPDINVPRSPGESTLGTPGIAIAVVALGSALCCLITARVLSVFISGLIVYAQT